MSDATLRERLLGSWHLLTQETHFDDGRIEFTRGANPKGILIYTESGLMSVHLVRADEHAAAFFDLRDEHHALDGYLGYFGRFAVDEAAVSVSHHLTGASYAPWIGTVLNRDVRFEDDRLILSARWDAASARRVITWTR